LTLVVQTKAEKQAEMRARLGAHTAPAPEAVLPQAEQPANAAPEKAEEPRQPEKPAALPPMAPKRGSVAGGPAPTPAYADVLSAMRSGPAMAPDVSRTSTGARLHLQDVDLGDANANDAAPVVANPASTDGVQYFWRDATTGANSFEPPPTARTNLTPGEQRRWDRFSTDNVWPREGGGRGLAKATVKRTV
jgi:hypothetical protein